MGCVTAHTVLHFVDGAWKLDHYGGTGPLCFLEEEREMYKAWPADIRQRVNC